MYGAANEHAPCMVLLMNMHHVWCCYERFIPPGPSTASTKPLKREDKEGPHILFREFQKLCEDLEGEPSYNAKSRLVEEFLEKGKVC